MKLSAVINGILFAGMVFTLPTTVMAADGKTTFQYEHNFKTMDRRHGDTFKIIHRTVNNWQYEFKFSTNAGGNSNYDTAYDDMQGASGGMVVQKQISLPAAFTLTPSFEFSIGSSAVTYQPGLKLSYKINKDWSTAFRYRYELKKVSRSDRYKTVSNSRDTVYNGVDYVNKPDTGRHRLDWSISYSGFKNFGLSYVFNYYNGDYVNTGYTYTKGSSATNNIGSFTKQRYVAYDDGRINYEHHFKISWKYSKQFQPYLELRDVAGKNTSTDSRQAQVKIGFNYVFN